MATYLNWLSAILPYDRGTGNAFVIGIRANVNGTGAGQPMAVSQRFSLTSDPLWSVNRPFWYYAFGNSSNAMLPTSGAPDVTSICAYTSGSTTYLFGLGIDGKPYALCAANASGNWGSFTMAANASYSTYQGDLVMGADGELLGVTPAGVPCIISRFASTSSVWIAGSATTTSSSNTNGLALSSTAPTSCRHLASVVAGSTEFIVGIESGSGGHPYLISVHTLGSSTYSNGSGSNFQIPNTYPLAYPLATLLSFTDSQGNGWLIGLTFDGRPMIVGMVNSSGVWTMGGTLPLYPKANSLFASLAIVTDESGNSGLAGIEASTGIPCLIAWLTASTGQWSAGSAIPRIQRLGQPVTFASLDSIVGGGGAGHLLGIGEFDGQLYEIANVLTLPTIGAGQGLLPAMTAVNRQGAEMMVSMLATHPPLLQTFIDKMTQDANATPVGREILYANTDAYILQRANPVTQSKFRCGTQDVIAAMANAAPTNIAMWSGCYGDVQFGPGQYIPSYLFITPDGSVFYGDYDLAARNWRFENNVLSWDPPKPGEKTGPPSGGSVTFDYSAPTEPVGLAGSLDAYIGPAFFGVFSGRLGAPATGMPPLPAYPRLPKISSVTTNATAPLSPGQSATVTATLDAPARYPGVTASVYFPAASGLSAPDTVTIPKGATSTTFVVTNIDPWGGSSSEGPKSVTIIVAAAGGSESVTVQLNLEPAPGTELPFSASITPSPVIGGQPATLQVTLDSVQQSAVSLYFASIPSTFADGIAIGQIVIPAGQTSNSATFSTDAVAPGAIVAQTVNANNTTLGNVAVSFDITTQSVTLGVFSLLVDPQFVLGGTIVNITVTLNDTPQTSQTVAFTITGDVDAIDSIPNITFAADAASMRTIAASTRRVASLRQVTITAALVNAPSNSGIASATLSVAPVPLTGLNCPASLSDEKTFTATLQLSSPAKGRGEFTINSTDSAIVQPPTPPTSTILQGQSSCSWAMGYTAPPSPVSVTLTVTGALPSEQIAYCIINAEPATNDSRAGWIVALVVGITVPLATAGAVYLRKYWKRRRVRVDPHAPVGLPIPQSRPSAPAVLQAFTQANAMARSAARSPSSSSTSTRSSMSTLPEIPPELMP